MSNLRPPVILLSVAREPQGGPPCAAASNHGAQVVEVTAQHREVDFASEQSMSWSS